MDTEKMCHPLVTACIAGNFELLKELLRDQQNPNECDSRGRTGLHLAAARGRDDILQLLIDSGADLAMADCLGNTALHYCGHTETIQFLVENGANIRARNQHGDDPLKLMKRRGVEKEAVRMMEGFLHDTDYGGDELKEPLLAKKRARKHGLQAFSTLWHEFCTDLGIARLLLVLVVALCVSLYVAYVVTGLSKRIETRIPVEDTPTSLEL